MKNVFVVGLEPFNKALLESLPNCRDCRFHTLLSYEEVVAPPARRIDFDSLLRLAEERLEDFPGTVEAIIGYWDFPTSGIMPILAHRHGLPAPSLEAVAACEHKYWSRIEQQRSVPELIPGFRLVNPFDDDPASMIDLPFPFWLKPVKAHSSFLGFRIRNGTELHHAIEMIRENIWQFSEPFDRFLSMVDIPPELAGIGGQHCIAEEIISQGRQCTLEGYVHRGEATVYGVVDSIRMGKHRSSFSRYQYPSSLPLRVTKRMEEAMGTFLGHIGYDNGAFNAEFFWEPRRDRIRLLEVNTRISKSHSPLFMMVDGAAHQQIPIDLSLGRKPFLLHREGKHRLAAKFMLRVFENGEVRHIPGADDIRRLKEQFPDALFRPLAHQGQELAHLPHQDSYSFELAELFLGARNQRELLTDYRKALELLPFELSTGETIAT